MCFQIPKQVKSISNSHALIEGGITVKLGTIKAIPGDYLMVYGNMAVEKISKEKALQSRHLIRNIEDSN